MGKGVQPPHHAYQPLSGLACVVTGLSGFGMVALLFGVAALLCGAWLADDVVDTFRAGHSSNRIQSARQGVQRRYAKTLCVRSFGLHWPIVGLQGNMAIF